MVQGSSVTTSVQPASRQPSPCTAAAARSASTSACAVGSARFSRSLAASASTAPPGARTTAPIGVSPHSCAAAASSSARPIAASSSAVTKHSSPPLCSAPYPGQSTTVPETSSCGAGQREAHQFRELGQRRGGFDHLDGREPQRTGGLEVDTEVVQVGAVRGLDPPADRLGQPVERPSVDL